MTHESHWRIEARKAIAQALKQTEGKPQDIVMTVIRDSYPFGERKRYPYKIWLDEVARMTGKKAKRKSAKNEMDLIANGQLVLL